MHCHIYVLLGVSGRSHIPWGPGMSVRSEFPHSQSICWAKHVLRGLRQPDRGQTLKCSFTSLMFSPNGWIWTSACSTFAQTTATARRKGHDIFHNNICLEAALSLTLFQRALSCFSGLSLTARASSPESLHLLPSLFTLSTPPSFAFHSASPAHDSLQVSESSRIR